MRPTKNFRYDSQKDVRVPDSLTVTLKNGD